MTLAINILMGVALINEAHHEILSKKTTVAIRIHFTIDSIFSVKGAFNQLYITNKMKHFSFIGGCAKR